MNDLWFTREGVREVDRLALERFGMPSIVLMENAARGLLDEALGLIAERGLRSAAVACGPGQNGGDGFALARLLDNAGVPVRIGHTRAAERYDGDARVNLEVVSKMGLPMTRLTGGDAYDEWMADAPGRRLIVDALLGTGLSRAPDGPIAEIIERMNARNGDGLLAVDVPSGFDADRGPREWPCVRADATVTLVGRKVGMASPAARAVLGRVTIGDIGVPRALAESLAVAGPC